MKWGRKRNGGNDGRCRYTSATSCLAAVQGYQQLILATTAFPGITDEAVKEACNNWLFYISTQPSPQDSHLRFTRASNHITSHSRPTFPSTTVKAKTMTSTEFEAQPVQDLVSRSNVRCCHMQTNELGYGYGHTIRGRDTSPIAQVRRIQRSQSDQSKLSLIYHPQTHEALAKSL